VLRLAALHSITSAKAQVEADAPTTVNSSVRNTRKYRAGRGRAVDGCAADDRRAAEKPDELAPPIKKMHRRRQNPAPLQALIDFLRTNLKSNAKSEKQRALGSMEVS
jgi:hypothetical protein